MSRSSPQVFDHSVKRTAAVGLTQFSALHDSALVASLENLRDAESDVRALESVIVDSLHGLISDAPANNRPALIAFRRDVFNRRRKWLTNLPVKEMVSEADPALRSDLERLERAFEHFTALTDHVATRLEARAAEESSHVLGISSQQELAAALVLSSPSVWSARERIAADPHKVSAKLKRSLFAYVQRGALKPAPLSTFATLMIEGPNSPSVAPVPEAHVSVTVARALVNALCVHEEFRDSFGFMPNVTLRVSSPRASRLISPMYQRIEGQFDWRRDDVLHAELPEAVAHQVMTLPRGASGSDVEEHFAGTASLRFLVDTGMILPVLPWHTTGDCALTQLAAALPPHHELTRTLHETAESVAELPRSTPNRRIEIQSGVQRDLGRAFAALDRVTPVSAQVRDVIRENSVGAASAESSAGEVDLAGTAAEVYEEGLFRGLLHDALIRHTRQIIGKPHGHAVIQDVPELLAQLSYGAESVTRYQSTQMDEAALAEDLQDRRQLSVARPVRTTASTPPPIGMAIIHHGLGAGTSVLDTLGAYGPGQFTRYLRGQLRASIAGELRSWVSGMTPQGTDLVEVTVATDQNDLQRDASGIWPGLKWPLDSHPDAGEITIDDLVISIDADDAVTITTRQGRPVQLMYVGAVPQTLISGPVRNLLALASPWSFLPLDTSEFKPAPAVLEHPVMHERRTRNGLVLARRTLECEMSEVPSSFLDKVTAQSLRALFETLSSWGFGDEVFVQLVPKTLSFAAAPKPSWVSCGSLASLESLRHEMLQSRGRHHLRITEALPSVGESIAAGAEAMTQTVHLLRGGGGHG